MAFSSVQASNFCGDIGLINHAPTLAFNPGELSTSAGFFYDALKYTITPITPYPAQYTAADWGDVLVVLTRLPIHQLTGRTGLNVV